MRMEKKKKKKDGLEGGKLLMALEERVRKREEKEEPRIGDDDDREGCFGRNNFGCMHAERVQEGQCDRCKRGSEVQNHM
ncbi:unnamed protein product [Sphenostylis stenocarpa]|uniref:Uncharacterized protein n=1 Tax=Sphenostylis stenocarpa TaxID=92480 RepID=A0AA86V6L6_9FABA|nr:unnamed protein product [Sphenostylis stenocarpa]